MQGEARRFLARAAAAKRVRDFWEGVQRREQAQMAQMAQMARRRAAVMVQRVTRRVAESRVRRGGADPLDGGRVLGRAGGGTSSGLLRLEFSFSGGSSFAWVDGV